MYENATIDDLKAAITEKNSMISYLKDRNEELQRAKRKVTGQKMNWRENALDIWDWCCNNLTNAELDGMFEECPGAVAFMQEHHDELE